MNFSDESPAAVCGFLVEACYEKYGREGAQRAGIDVAGTRKAIAACKDAGLLQFPDAPTCGLERLYKRQYEERNRVLKKAQPAQSESGGIIPKDGRRSWSPERLAIHKLRNISIWTPEARAAHGKRLKMIRAANKRLLSKKPKQ